MGSSAAWSEDASPRSLAQQSPTAARAPFSLNSFVKRGGGGGGGGTRPSRAGKDAAAAATATPLQDLINPDLLASMETLFADSNAMVIAAFEV
jgi:hypothetical protein